jgi:superkiller protein 3
MPVIIALALLLSPDIIYLNDGRQVEGRIIEEGAGYVRVETAQGEIEFDRFDIKKIEKKPWTPPPKPEKPKPAAKPKPKPEPEKPKEPKPAAPEQPWQKVKLDTQYRDPFINFRINFPKDWKASAEKDKSDRADVIFEGPRDGIYVPKVHMYIERPKKELVDIISDQQKQLKETKDYTDMAFKNMEMFPQGGKNAAMFLATYKEGIIAMATLWFYIDAGERKVTLMFTTTEVLMGRYENSIKAVMRSLRMFDEHKVDADTRKTFTRLYNTGAEMTNQKKYDEAAKNLEDALKIAPNYPDLHNVIGRVYASLKNWTKACDAFQKASDLDPDNFEYAFNTAVMLRTQKKYPEALKFAERACDIDPRSEPAHTSLGIILIMKRDHKKAKEVLNRAVELNPESASAHFYLGVAHEATNNLAEAEKEYKETLKIDAKHEEAQAGLKRIKESKE